MKTNMSPENQWLEDVFLTKIVPFWGHVSFQGCKVPRVIERLTWTPQCYTLQEIRPYISYILVKRARKAVKSVKHHKLDIKQVPQTWSRFCSLNAIAQDPYLPTFGWVLWWMYRYCKYTIHGSYGNLCFFIWQSSRWWAVFSLTKCETTSWVAKTLFHNMFFHPASPRGVFHQLWMMSFHHLYVPLSLRHLQKDCCSCTALFFPVICCSTFI